jgi:excisionase family DNA binding protein
VRFDLFLASVASELGIRDMTDSTTHDPDQLLTEREAAELLRQTVKTLQARRVTGGGCQYVKLGRSVRYRRQDVHDYIKSSLRTSTTVESPPDAR